MVTEKDRQWMWEHYAPEPRMRLNLGIRRRLAPLLDNDPHQILLAYSILFTLPGSPIIYYGDEIGMGDNIGLPDRNGLRTPMQWTDGNDAGFSTAHTESLYLPVISSNEYSPERVNAQNQKSTPNSLYQSIRNMILTRQGCQAFGEGKMKWMANKNKAVLVYWRELEEERIIVINNLSNRSQSLPLKEVQMSQDLLRHAPFPGERIVDGIVTLEPYEFLWLRVT
jgi:maltose alpha-D-glucosyltransferase/alpha-amylase